MEQCAEMPTYNLAKMMHNKWLQPSGNKMTCLYEAMIDDMIRAFMQIANYRSWFKGGYSWKKPNQTSLKLKTIADIGDPKFLAEAMRFYSRGKDLNTRNCELEGFEMPGSPRESWICLHGLGTILIIRTRWITPSHASTQGLVGHDLRSHSYMIKMWCHTPLACWSQSVWNTNGTIPNCLILHKKKCEAL